MWEESEGEYDQNMLYEMLKEARKLSKDDDPNVAKNHGDVKTTKITQEPWKYIQYGHRISYCLLGYR